MSIVWRKSSRSGPYSDNCVEMGVEVLAGLDFRAASGCASGACVQVAGCESNACVEVAGPDGCGDVYVRDSKNPTGPVLTFTREEWKVFTAGVKTGEFDF